MIVQRVAQYIEKEKLLTLQDKVLVTLSGGADSIALLRVLLALGHTCEAAHCNFRLREEESDRDERFVRQLCQTLRVPLHVTTFDTVAYAQTQKVSIEMAARELRYEWFNTLKVQHGFSAIAVAHHQDDSVETMLLNLIRGTGINGLLGIHPKQKDIIRPLLCVTRDEVESYLERIGQTYVTDSTNLQDDFTRNKIRLKLIPFMQEINPSVKSGLFQTGNHLKEVATIYQQVIAEGKQRVQTEKGIDIALLLTEPSPQALLFEILYPLGFTSTQVDNIVASLDGQPGKQFISKNNWRVVRDREYLLIDQLNATAEDAPPFQLTFEKKVYSPDFIISKEKHIACFDADKFEEPICVRKWQQGDKFVPFGMKGKKRVSDYLTDRKFSISQKEKQWVLCSNNKIAWVIGERTDNRFRVDDTTRNILIVTLQ